MNKKLLFCLISSSILLLLLFSLLVKNQKSDIKDIKPADSSLIEHLKDTPTLGRVTYAVDFFYEPLPQEILDRISGLSYTSDCTTSLDDLRYIQVKYINFNNETCIGEIICNKFIAEDLVEIFYELYENSYPIASIRLIDDFDASDSLSMSSNNTSCFNYRTTTDGSKISKHALGLAIDINPLFNPYVIVGSNPLYYEPSNAGDYCDRTKDFAGKITTDDLCYKLFIEHGFTWGGSWKNVTDYQHFEKAID